MTIPSQAGEPDKKLELNCLRPTVLIQDITGSFGSGTIIRSAKVSKHHYVNVVITCKHVVKDKNELTVSTIGYKDWSEPDRQTSAFYPARIYLMHPRNDIAFILFESREQQPVAKLGFDEKLYIGNDIFGIGCAFREFPRVDYAKISGLLPSVMRANLLTIPGDSGGPVFHNYKVIALKTLIMLPRIDGVQYAAFTMSKHTRITVLKSWEKYDKRAMIYKKDQALPQLPILFLRASMFKPKMNFLQDLFHGL